MIDKCARLVAIFAGAIVCFGVAASFAAEPKLATKIEGVWQITKPITRLVPADGAEILFTDEGKEYFEENKKQLAIGTRLAYDEYDIAKSRCSSPGVPRLMLTPKRFKIWNRLSVLTFDFEWNRAIRQVDLSGKEVKLPLVPNMNGIAKGYWEGETLVIKTVDVSDRTLIDDLVPHSADMKVTERYRLVNRNTLENRIIIEDPAYFTQPWEAVVQYKRQRDALFPEDICMDRLEAGDAAFAASDVE